MTLRRSAVLGCGLLCAAGAAQAGGAATAAPWWLWPLALFFVCLLLGLLTVPAGIGGGVLFVPIVGGFFPFHLDFVRGAGLLVALASALAAGPTLLRGGLASLRLALPLALLASVGSVAGALLGLALPANAVQLMLGCAVLGIVALMLLAGRRAAPAAAPLDALARALALHGVYLDGATGQRIEWQARHTLAGLATFLGIGLLGGIFGIGAGWANVPALNLLMGVPLKVAAGTSGLVLSLAGSAAAWVYIEAGAVLALVAAPAVLGMMLGARLGAGLLHRLDGVLLRRLVLGLLLLAGLRALLKGSGVWP